MLKAGFISLGCSKNLVDTEVMLGILAKNNIEITAEPAKADILIVNTCTFIQSAKEESITTILNMAEYKQEGKGKCRSLIIAGCMGQRYGQELLEEFPEVDAIVGTGAWSRIMEAVEATIQERKRVLITGESKEIYTAFNTTYFYYFHFIVHILKLPKAVIIVVHIVLFHMYVVIIVAVLLRISSKKLKL